MRRFLIGFLASVGAFSLLFLIGAGIAGWWAYSSLMAEEPLPERAVLMLDLREPVAETPAVDPLDVVQLDSGLTLDGLVRGLEEASKDPSVRGLVARLDGAGYGFAAAQEIRAAVARFTESGRFAVAWSSSFGELTPANQGYYIATAFDEIHLQPGGILGLTGLLIEIPFARGLLAELGVEPEVIRRADYKTALESFTERDITEPHREMLASILDALYGQLTGAIAAARGLEQERVRSLIDNGPHVAEQALEAGLVDALGYRSDVEARAGTLAEGDWQPVSFEGYVARLEDDDDTGTEVALLRAQGAIQQGEGAFGSAIAADELAAVIEDARENERFAALLLRLDSPGGSAVGSETIAHEIRKTIDGGKPVVVSMGNRAASGGYWIAMGASRIVAQPATLTGSIGVIAGKPVLARTWDELEVSWARIQRGENAELWSLNTGFDEQGRARVESLVDDTYRRFLEGVAEGRGMSVERVREIAGGRVWTGEQAQERGLVDTLGGYEQAKAELRSLLDLGEDETLRLVPFPEPAGRLDRVLALFEDDWQVSGELRSLVRLIGGLLSAHDAPLRMPSMQVGR